MLTSLAKLPFRIPIGWLTPYFHSDRPKAQHILAWLNPAAFSQNAIGTSGVLGRNGFRGPGYANLDAGIFKTFTVYERLSATFRFEAFNALNRTNLNLPSATVTSSTFMKITSAYDPRILQFALRLKW